MTNMFHHPDGTTTSAEGPFPMTLLQQLHGPCVAIHAESGQMRWRDGDILEGGEWNIRLLNANAAHALPNSFNSEPAVPAPPNNASSSLPPPPSNTAAKEGEEIKQNLTLNDAMFDRMFIRRNDVGKLWERLRPRNRTKVPAERSNERKYFQPVLEDLVRSTLPETSELWFQGDKQPGNPIDRIPDISLYPRGSAFVWGALASVIELKPGFGGRDNADYHTALSQVQHDAQLIIRSDANGRRWIITAITDLRLIQFVRFEWRANINEWKTEATRLLPFFPDDRPVLATRGFTLFARYLAMSMADFEVTYWLPKTVELPPNSYHIEELLGNGGFSVVYGVRRDPGGEKLVLKQALNDDPDYIAHISHETSALSAVQRAFPAGLLPLGLPELVDASPGYIVTKPLGESLYHLLASNTAIPASQLIKYCIHAFDALKVLHSIGIIHGDVRPPNIIVAGSQARLVDLGLACDGACTRGDKHTVVRGVMAFAADGVLNGSRMPGGYECCPKHDIQSLLFTVVSLVHSSKLWDRCDGVDAVVITRARARRTGMQEFREAFDYLDNCPNQLRDDDYMKIRELFSQAAISPAPSANNSADPFPTGNNLW
ncbi:hypothetical protein HK104_000834 [Borealophlyctis nickersoniae]|nr:hypothetical protein HK104_000834 [Borealophlyctis nickersoniae]